jgi:hypothetical protein
MTETKKNPKNVIQLLLSQSDAYDTIERIESLLEDLDNLRPLPVQPLFTALKALEPAEIGSLLPKLSVEQRQAFLDIDLWNKDEVSVDAFPLWIQSYLACPDDKIRLEFARGEDFLLYLKSAFNVWTFDIDDPQYPDHDNYFLTEDSLVLVEFHDNYPYMDEVKTMIKHLYSELGVEKAYEHLLLMMSESFSVLEESNYQSKINRLRDFGILDYYDALELLNPLPSVAHVEHYLAKKQKSFTPKLDDETINQTLHHSALVAYRDKLDRFTDELMKIKNQQRIDFLHFNFLKTVNASIAKDNALKEGRIALTRIGNKTRTAMLLGFDYTKNFIEKSGQADALLANQSLFERFDFVDLFKVGQTLVQTKLKTLKKNIDSYQFEENNEAFLGKYWIDFLDESFADVAKVGVLEADQTIKYKVIDRLDLYHLWCDRLEVFLEFLPFIVRFRETFVSLRENGKLQDHFYLNYNTETIDFEAIILSSFANLLIGSYDKEKNPEGSPKMGLTINEFKKFSSIVLNEQGEVRLANELEPLIERFRKQFGFYALRGFSEYLREILVGQLEGYDYHNLSEEDYRHVGGPIILSLN